MKSSRFDPKFVSLVFQYFQTRKTPYISRNDIFQIQREIVNEFSQSLDKKSIIQLIYYSRKQFMKNPNNFQKESIGESNINNNTDIITKNINNINRNTKNIINNILINNRINITNQMHSNQYTKDDSIIKLNDIPKNELNLIKEEHEKKKFNNIYNLYSDILSEDQLEYIRKYIWNKQDKHEALNIAKVSIELEKQLSISRQYIKDIIKKLNRGKIYDYHRQLVSHFIEEKIKSLIKKISIRIQNSMNSLDLDSDTDDKFIDLHTDSILDSNTDSQLNDLLDSHIDSNLDSNQNHLIFILGYLENNIPELCNYLEKYLNDCSRDQIYELILRDIHRRKKILISQEEKEKIISFIESNPQLHNDLKAIREKYLEKYPNSILSYSQLRSLLKNSLTNIKRKSISKLDKEYISNYLKSIDFFTNLKELPILNVCDDLEKKMNLSRKQIYEIVTASIHSYFRNVYLPENKLELLKIIDMELMHLGNNISKRENISIVCDKLINLETFSNIPRSVLYEFVSKRIMNQNHRKISSSNLNFIKDYILKKSNFDEIISFIQNKNKSINNNENLICSSDIIKDEKNYQSMNIISKLCDEINRHIEIPRDQLYQIVYRILNKSIEKKLNQNEIEFIKMKVEENYSSNKTMKPSEVIEEIKELKELSHIPSRQIYYHIYRHIKRIDKNKLQHEDYIKIERIVSNFLLNEFKINKDSIHNQNKNQIHDLNKKNISNKYQEQYLNVSKSIKTHMISIIAEQISKNIQNIGIAQLREIARKELMKQIKNSI